MVERMAVVRGPEVQYLALQDTTSEATHTKGMGRDMKSSESW